MEVQFTPDQEALLAQISTRTGTDTERLVKDAVLRLLEGETGLHPLPPHLPILHLGEMKSLHRRDLYDDAR